MCIIWFNRAISQSKSFLFLPNQRWPQLASSPFRPKWVISRERVTHHLWTITSSWNIIGRFSPPTQELKNCPRKCKTNIIPRDYQSWIMAWVMINGMSHYWWRKELSHNSLLCFCRPFLLPLKTTAAPADD